MTGGAIVARALEDEGIPFAFGIPGTHNIELYDALAVSESVRPILVTDEQSASFMADGVWRASRRLGCVNVVPGAGLTHALSGIAEAFLDTVPMLVLGCGPPRHGEGLSTPRRRPARPGRAGDQSGLPPGARRGVVRHGPPRVSGRS
jgi:thiamine pyrophosphate-dependent acetolactate synthase large subunit-like protein